MPVSPSAPPQSERLPPNFPFDDLISHLEARVVQTELSRTHSGPLPDVETLRGYAEIIPDGAERTMRMAEKEQAMRHGVLWTRERRAWAGVVCAFLLGLGSMALAAFAIYLKQPVAGCVVFVSTIAAIAGTFIRGTSTHQLPEAERNEEKGIKKKEAD